jgi:hypothetical protein
MGKKLLTDVLEVPESLAPGLHNDPRAMGSPEDGAGAIEPPVHWRAKGVGLYV